MALRSVEAVTEASPVASEALMIRGLALVALNRIEESRQALELALEIGPVQPMAAKVLAAIYFSRSESDRGLDLLRLAAEVDPADFRPWFAMGEVYQRIGDPKSAIDSYTDALRRRPVDRGSLIGLIDAYLDIGAPEAATPHLEVTLRMSPEDPEVLSLAARHALDLGDVIEALRYADHCLSVEPDLVDARLTRARIQRVGGRPDLALPDAEAAVRLAPNDLGALSLLAVTESAAGLPERAAATSARHQELTARLGRMHELTAAIKERPDDPEPRWRLGQEAVEAGEQILAEQSFRAALALDPDCGPASQGLARLGVPVVPPNIGSRDQP